jgi:HSP20 family molecular chaperone IbpA
MQLLVPPAKYVGALTPIKKPARTGSSRKSTGPYYAVNPAISDGLLPEIAVSETAGTLNMTVPLRGVDARKVFVVASAHSILIEVRITNSVPRSGFIYKEVQQQRITRELRFRENIVKGSTFVRYFGGDLEITCLKVQSADETSWSELVRLDTRNFLGCVR